MTKKEKIKLIMTGAISEQNIELPMFWHEKDGYIIPIGDDPPKFRFTKQEFAKIRQTCFLELL